MKKTLITLLALGGIACGASITNATSTEFDAWFDTAVAGYTTGDDYELSITLNEYIPTQNASGDNAIGYKSFMILTLGEGSTDGSSWGIFTQGGQYLAFDDSGTDGRNGLTTSTGSSYTSGNKEKARGSLAAPTEGWFYNLGSSTKEEIEGLTITLAREDGKQTLSILDIDGTTEIANFTITSDIDLADITVSERFKHTASFTAVPEPTTATLSLLALCGLAARRRRR